MAIHLLSSPKLRANTAPLPRIVRTRYKGRKRCNYHDSQHNRLIDWNWLTGCTIDDIIYAARTDWLRIAKLFRIKRHNFGDRGRNNLLGLRHNQSQFAIVALTRTSSGARQTDSSQA